MNETPPNRSNPITRPTDLDASLPSHAMPTRALDLAARAGRKALALVVLTYTVHSTANAIRGGGVGGPAEHMRSSLLIHIAFRHDSFNWQAAFRYSIRIHNPLYSSALRSSPALLLWKPCPYYDYECQGLSLNPCIRRNSYDGSSMSGSSIRALIISRAYK